MSWFCWIPLATSLFAGCGSEAPLAVGYVEGEYVLVAPIETAEIRNVPVRRGERVEKGALLAELVVEDADIAVAQAEAAAGQARAQLALRQAEANLDQARWRRSQRTLRAQAAGRIGDVLRDPGEIAGPAAPVLSLLPDGGVKLKLYIGEPDFASIAVGSKLAVRCDGCPDGMTATVGYVSPDPEFTPPVIYSLENRQKLVYLIEARPDDPDSRLQPGQIVDVTALP